MKKLFALLIFVGVLYSCSDESNQPTVQENQRVAAVLKESNFENQKLMYQMLSNQDKNFLWHSKMDKMLADQRLTEAQANLLADLKSHFTTELFDQTSRNDQREVFKNVYVTGFLKKAQKLFAWEYIHSNFYTIGAKVPPGGSLPECTCNTSSMWSCAMRDDCRPSSTCLTTMDGCGFATMYECDGKCYL